MRDGDVAHVIEIGRIGVNVGESEFCGFDLQMERVAAVEHETVGAVGPHDSQRHQRRDALPVRRDLMQ